MELTRPIQDALAAPFPEDEIEFLPRNVRNGRALALAYIDARAVMNRLDAVVGSGNWHFTFEPLTADCKAMKGSLTVCGVTKCDAGQASTEDEPIKSAVSDSLKRAAVHFGIGRFLYDLPPIWHEYDEGKRRWVTPPRLPQTQRQIQAPRDRQEWNQRVTAAAEAHAPPAPPITGGNGDDEVKRQRLRLAAVLKAADLSIDDARPIASVVLDKPVERIGELGPDEVARVVAFVEEQPTAAAAIVACPQDETLPLDDTAGAPAGLAQS
jgi:hypothetical protein